MSRVALLLVGALATPVAAASVTGRGHELYFQGRFDDALRAYREAVHRSSTDVKGQLNLGVLYRDAGRPAEAAKAFAAAAELTPDDPDAWTALGEAALQARDLPAAQQAFSRALDETPGHFFASIGMGRIHIERGEPRLAAERFLEASHARPESALASYLLGRAEEAQGLLEQARGAYQEALTKDSQFAETRIALGRVFSSLARANEAWQQFAKVTDLDPAHAAAVRAKQQLSARITKTPEELVPVARIAAPRRILPSPGRASQPVLRVAIGTTPSGKPIADKAMAFRAGGAFVIEHKPSGRKLASGGPGETWVLRKVPHEKDYEVLGPDGRRRAAFSAPVWIRLRDPEHATLIFEAVPSAQGYAWSQLKDKEVRGLVEARPHPAGGLYLVNHIPLEDYLYGVVAEEMPIRWPAEALKAQSVIARTHALNLKTASPHRDLGYDLCDGQHCQVYGGVDSEYSPTRRAVDATHGEVLKYQGRFAQTFYSSNCGGHTQSSQEVGWGALPYLKGAPDVRRGMEVPASPWEFELWVKRVPRAYCQNPRFTHPPEFRWSRVIPAEELSARVGRRSAIGRVRSVRAQLRGRSGHIHKLVVEGAQGTWETTSEAAIRRVLGLGPVRSTFFLVEAYRDASGKVQDFVLHGAGWGHAVGLCQSGAAGRAADGAAYAEILAHYYPGTEIGPAEPPTRPAKRPPVPPKRMEKK